MRQTRNRTPHAQERASLEDRSKILAAIAKANHTLGPTHINAIGRRLKMCHTRVSRAMTHLHHAEMVFHDPNPEDSNWHLTEKGWAAVGQTPPIWKREVAA